MGEGPSCSTINISKFDVVNFLAGGKEAITKVLTEKITF